MAFTPRLNSAGMKGSKYYYSDNVFYNANLGPQQTGGNCTWYAWGRFYEIRKRYPSGLSTSDAKNWYSRTTGYAKGRTPKLGAIACWEYRNGGAGHVAVVEQIKPNGDIVTSNSGWSSGKYFWTETVTKASGYIPSWANARLQGFIYVDVDTGTVLPADLHWISITRYPDSYTGNDSQNNAYCVANNLLLKGWSINAICGVLGNMTIESFISPTFKEYGGDGYGLVQWTPSTNITNYMQKKNSNWRSSVDVQGNLQCDRLEDERHDNPREWYVFNNVPAQFRTYSTMDAFATGTSDPAKMAGCFVYCYERPGNYSTLADRQKYARYYWNLLKDYKPLSPTGRGERVGMPIWMYPMFRRLR